METRNRIHVLDEQELNSQAQRKSVDPVYMPIPEDVSFEYLESLVGLLDQLSDELLASRMLNFRARIRAALRRIAGFIGVDSAFLWLMDEHLTEFHDVLVSSQDVGSFPEWNHLPALQKHPALLERLERNSEAVAAVLEGPPKVLRGYLLWPLRLDGRMRAVLGFSERNALKRWTVWERQLLEIGGTVFRQEIVRQRNEQIRRRSELRYRLLASHYPNGMVLLFDRETRFLVAEGEAGARWGLTPERLEGRTVREVFPGDVSETIEGFCRRTLAGETVVEEMSYAGEVIEMRLVPVRTGNSAVMAGMLVAQIITERKEAEASLRQAREALEKARAQEAAVAAEIQQNLLFGRLPACPPSISMDAVSIPSMEVDGDFYDFFPIREHIYDLVIGDVMGKGTPAALIGAAARIAFLRSLSRLLAREGRRLPEPEALLGMVHGELAARLANLYAFVTLVFARLNMHQKTLQIVNCGHPPVLVYRQEESRFFTIDSTRPPLGISDVLDYSCTTVSMRRGDIIVFLSDGVTEARNPDGEMFGLERIKDVVRLGAPLPAGELVAAIRDAVQRFVGTRGLEDDFTCLVVRLEP
ncbi:SpoIIE family protein phosphatase [Candidatus Ozemobacteraceae bacterium]|nr:SpoIIE family protein phosphatase [Candidatus Ozemobacteraceae bacterium]